MLDNAGVNLRRNGFPATNQTMNVAGGNSVLSRLPPVERERLMPYLEPVNIHFGEVLVEFDYNIEDVYFFETAVTSTVVRTPHGDTLEVGLMGAEGFVGLSLLYGVSRSNATVITQIPGRALRMKAADFNRHIKSAGGLCLDLLLRYANFFQVMVQQHAACNASHSIEERMCRWVLLTHDRAARHVCTHARTPLAHARCAPRHRHRHSASLERSRNHQLHAWQVDGRR